MIPFDQIKRKITSRTSLLVLAAVVGIGIVLYLAFNFGSPSNLSIATSVDGVKTEKPVITILGEKGAVTATCGFGSGVTPKNPQCSWSIKTADSNTTVKTTRVDNLTSNFFISAAKVRSGQFTLVGNISDGSKKATKEIIVSFNLQQEIASSVVGISKVDIMYKEEKLADGASIAINASDAVTMDLSTVAYDLANKVSRDPITYLWTINSLDGNMVLKNTIKDKSGQSVSLSVTPKDKNTKKGNIRINLRADNQGKQKTFVTDFSVTFSSFDTKLIYNFTNLNIAYFADLKNSLNLKKLIDPMIIRIAPEIANNPQINKVFEDELKELKKIDNVGIEKDILANEKNLVDLAASLQEKKKLGSLSNDDIGAFFNAWLKIYAQVDYMNS